MSGPLLTARQVAELIGVSSETILRWTRRGDLPAIRLPGGALRYRGPDLDGWLAARATSTDTGYDKCPGAVGAARGVAQGE
jgi:excisionase family DNA binding protein